MTMAVKDDNALDTFIHWYEQDTNDFQQRLSDVRDSLKDLNSKVDTSSPSVDEETTRKDHETLQSKVKENLGCSRLIGLIEFEIVSYGKVDTMRNALPFLDETVKLIAETYDKIMNIWTEFKLFCNSGLPAEILRMDEKSIELYKKALADGSVPDYNIRLMIVGHVNVGKTTLKRRLFGECVNIEERQSTQGIEVHVGRCQVDMLSKKWKVQEKDGRMDAIFQRLAKLLRLQDSSSNPARPNEVHFQRDDNEKSNLTDSHVDVLYESSSSLNLDKGLPSQTDQQQLITPLPMPRKPNDQKEITKEKESCLSDIKEILKQSAKLDKNQQTAELSIWDFAGQSDFYAMHQVFLSRRAVYLLVTNLTEHISSIVEDEFCRDCTREKNMKIIEYIEFWLNSIYEHTQRDVHKEGPEQIIPNAIMVGTHADKIRKDNTEEPCVDFINTVWNYLDGKVTIDLLTDKYFRIDNTIDPADPASEINDLGTYILETASKQSYWGKKIPAKWFTLEHILLILQNEGTKVLKRSDIEDLNKIMPVEMQSDEVEIFLNFEHDSGNIIYFSHEQQLKENIILEPKWLIDAFTSILTAKKYCQERKDLAKVWREFESTAVLRKPLIDSIWDQTQYSEFKQHSELILCYMEKFGFIAKPTQDGITTTDEYWVPHFLKEKVPKNILQNDDKDRSTSKLCLTTPTGFLPKTTFNKLLAACIRQFNLSGPAKKKHIYCGCGVFDLVNCHQLIVCFHNNVIYIWLKRMSTKDNDPDVTECFKVFDFVLNILTEDLKKVEMFYKCQTSTIESDFRLTQEELSQNEEVRCYCKSQCMSDERQEDAHTVETLEITKYWQSTFVLPGTGYKIWSKKEQFSKTNGDIITATDHDLINKGKDSVGALRYPGGLGTAFRVGSKYVMTALHVVQNILDLKYKGSTDRAMLTDKRIFVDFNTSSQTPGKKVYYLTQNLLHDEELDVAILEISDPDGLPPPLYLEQNMDAISNLEKVTLIGYGHPQNQDKMLEYFCELIPSDSPRIIKATNWWRSEAGKIKSLMKYDTPDNSALVDVGYQGYDLPQNFVLNNYMQHGASGSPIVRSNGLKLIVVGMFKCGLPKFFFYMKDIRKHLVKPEYVFAMGTKMSFIYERVKFIDSNVAGDIFPD